MARSALLIGFKRAVPENPPVEKSEHTKGSNSAGLTSQDTLDVTREADVNAKKKKNRLPGHLAFQETQGRCTDSPPSRILRSAVLLCKGEMNVPVAFWSLGTGSFVVLL